jgi:hypothetical protein
MRAISYTSRYARFVETQAFHVRARAKLDAVIAQAHAARHSEDVRAYMRVVSAGRTVRGALAALRAE